MLKYASRNTTSLTILTIPTGIKDIHIVTMYNRVFETGKCVERRMMRGKGRDGAVIRMEGIVNARVAALKKATAALKPMEGFRGEGSGDGVGVSCAEY